MTMIQDGSSVCQKKWKKAIQTGWTLPKILKKLVEVSLIFGLEVQPERGRMTIVLSKLTSFDEINR